MGCDVLPKEPVLSLQNFMCAQPGSKNVWQKNRQELEKLWGLLLLHTHVISNGVDRIIFCVFLEVDFKIYKKKMSEFFSVDDNNEEEEDVEMKEDSEGLEPKGLSPPHKKSKAKKPECSKDSSEDENGPEEKQSVEEMEGQSQDADGVNTVTVPGPASEEAVEDCKDEDSAKDDNITKGSEVTDHSVCDQDHPHGFSVTNIMCRVLSSIEDSTLLLKDARERQENDSTKNEIKIETESQSSYMETEELASNQEDAVIVEKPEVIPLTDDQEEKEGEKEKDAYGQVCK
ncbi:hypothetical protein H8959_022548 [Pygathrix nigripes]